MSTKKKPLVNLKAFSLAIIAKRTKDDLTIRDAAASVGVPVKRLWTADSGNMIKTDTYVSICFWLGKPLDTFINKPSSK